MDSGQNKFYIDQMNGWMVIRISTSWKALGTAVMMNEWLTADDRNFYDLELAPTSVIFSKSWFQETDSAWNFL